MNSKEKEEEGEKSRNREEEKKQGKSDQYKWKKHYFLELQVDFIEWKSVTISYNEP